VTSSKIIVKCLWIFSTTFDKNIMEKVMFVSIEQIQSFQNSRWVDGRELGCKSKMFPVRLCLLIVWGWTRIQFWKWHCHHGQLCIAFRYKPQKWTDWTWLALMLEFFMTDSSMCLKPAPMYPKKNQLNLISFNAWALCERQLNVFRTQCTLFSPKNVIAVTFHLGWDSPRSPMTVLHSCRV
jgi:hypothetical protein